MEATKDLPPLTRVGRADFIDFIRIKPNLSFTTFHDSRSESLLSSQVDPTLKVGEERRGEGVKERERR